MCGKVTMLNKALELSVADALRVSAIEGSGHV